jgi:hypothetical protein
VLALAGGAEAAQALRRLDREHVFGRIVLKVRRDVSA